MSLQPKINQFHETLDYAKFLPIFYIAKFFSWWFISK